MLLRRMKQALGLYPISAGLRAAVPYRQWVRDCRNSRPSYNYSEILTVMLLFKYGRGNTVSV